MDSDKPISASKGAIPIGTGSSNLSISSSTSAGLKRRLSSGLEFARNCAIPRAI